MRRGGVRPRSDGSREVRAVCYCVAEYHSEGFICSGWSIGILVGDGAYPPRARCRFSVSRTSPLAPVPPVLIASFSRRLYPTRSQYTPRPHSSPTIDALRASLRVVGDQIRASGTPESLGPCVIGITGYVHMFFWRLCMRIDGVDWSQERQRHAGRALDSLRASCR